MGKLWDRDKLKEICKGKDNPCSTLPSMQKRKKKKKSKKGNEEGCLGGSIC